MNALTIKLRKGGVLLELIIVGALVGIITVCLLNFYGFSRNIFIESKESLVAVNALDTVMTYFENHISEWPSTSNNFLTFADNSIEPPILTYMDKIAEGANLTTVLNQLRRWKIEYRVDEHSGTNTFEDKLVVLRISWDAVRKGSGGNPARVTKEIFSIFTSRVW